MWLWNTVRRARQSLPFRHCVSQQHLATTTNVATPQFGAVDHVCICCTDVEASIDWFKGVLGLEMKHDNHECFYPTDPASPAFLSRGQVNLALFPLRPGDPATVQNGQHFALNVSRKEFDRLQEELPVLLEAHKSHGKHRTDVEVEDYGLQLSMFFRDPDDNVVEFCTWDV